MPVVFWNETVGGWSGEENWIIESTRWNKSYERASDASSARNWNSTSAFGPSDPMSIDITSPNLSVFFAKRDHHPAAHHAHGHSSLNMTSQTPSPTESPPGADDEQGNGDKKLTIKPDWSSNLNKSWAYFTYTPSLAWAWRPRSDFDLPLSNAALDISEQHESFHPHHHGHTHGHDHDHSHGADDGYGQDGHEADTILRSMHVGYLDDEVIVGIGLEDTGQAWAKVKAEELLGCLVACPGFDLHGQGENDDRGAGVGTEEGEGEHPTTPPVGGPNGEDDMDI